VVDATDQQIEQAAERVETMIATARGDTEPTGPPGEVPLAQLNHATQQMEEAVERVETAVTEAQDHSDPNGTTGTTPHRKDSDSEQKKKMVT